MAAATRSNARIYAPLRTVVLYRSCADQALYYAKTHGRNRVAFYEALLANGEIEAYQRTPKT